MGHKIFHNPHALDAFIHKYKPIYFVEDDNMVLATVVASKPDVPQYIHRNTVDSVFGKEENRHTLPYLFDNRITLIGTAEDMTPQVTESIRCLDDHLNNTERLMDNYVEQACYNTDHIINNVACHCAMDNCEVYDVTTEVYNGPHGQVVVYWVSHA